MSSPIIREQLRRGRDEDPMVFALRLYVQFLQGLFNQTPVGTFHWEPDNETSEIVIRGEAPLDMSVVGKRPAITVVSGPVNIKALGWIICCPTTPKQAKELEQI